MLRLVIIAFGTTVIATPLVRAMARRIGRIAHPTVDRWHAQPVALLGGIAIFVGVIAGIVALSPQLAQDSWTPGAGVLRIVAGIVLSSCVMFLTGLVDDLVGLKPTTKLILQAVSGAILVSSGAIFSVVPSTVINVLLTVFWFIALTNATNLLDNMDGITAGTAAIAAFGFAALFADEPALAGIALAVAGATVGFLIFNFSRASIFMGDAGSLFLGSMLAGLGASYSALRVSHKLDSVVLPLLLVLVPVLDTLLVMSTRLLAGRPVMQGGKDHTTHRLARVGLRDWQVALAVYSVGAVAAILAIDLARTSSAATAWGGILFVLAMLVVQAYLAKLSVYPQTSDVPIRRLAILLDDLLYKRRILDVLVDLVVFASAYWGAFLLRWDGAPPVSQAVTLADTVALVVGIRVVAFFASGVYHGRWHQVSVPDVHRVFRGTLLGSVASWLIIGRAWPGEVPASLFLLDGILVLLLAFAVRLSFRSLDTMRFHIGRRGRPTLIYGAGSGGELTVRELHANDELGLYPVGFIDDDPYKKGALILGIPVLGSITSLPQILRTQAVEKVVIGTAGLQSDARAALVEACRAAHVELSQLRLDLAKVDVSALDGASAGSMDGQEITDRKKAQGDGREAKVVARIG
jgi:UDP-GlcNAc:undecaprenyl-phosphate GlcNAc-1-phosphate transferase